MDPSSPFSSSFSSSVPMTSNSKSKSKSLSDSLPIPIPRQNHIPLPPPTPAPVALSHVSNPFSLHGRVKRKRKDHNSLHTQSGEKESQRERDGDGDGDDNGNGNGNGNGDGHNVSVRVQRVSFPMLSSPSPSSSSPSLSPSITVDSPSAPLPLSLSYEISDDENQHILFDFYSECCHCHIERENSQNDLKISRPLPPHFSSSQSPSPSSFSSFSKYFDYFLSAWRSELKENIQNEFHKQNKIRNQIQMKNKNPKIPDREEGHRQGVRLSLVNYVDVSLPLPIPMPIGPHQDGNNITHPHDTDTDTDMDPPVYRIFEFQVSSPLLSSDSSFHSMPNFENISKGEIIVINIRQKEKSIVHHHHHHPPPPQNNNQNVSNISIPLHVPTHPPITSSDSENNLGSSSDYAIFIFESVEMSHGQNQNPLTVSHSSYRIRLKRCFHPSLPCCSSVCSLLFRLPLHTLDIEWFSLSFPISAMREFFTMKKIPQMALGKILINPNPKSNPLERKSHEKNPNISLSNVSYDSLPTPFRFHFEGILNDSQLSVLKICQNNFHFSHEGFTLIQGPPGTGKTTTLVAILNVFHWTKFQIYYKKFIEHSINLALWEFNFGEKPLGANVENIIGIVRGAMDRVRGVEGNSPCSLLPKILICCPSNAAIDEILFRILSSPTSFVDGNLHQYRPNIIRIGQTEIPTAISLDSLLDFHTSPSTQIILDKWKFHFSSLVKKRKKMKIFRKKILKYFIAMEIQKISQNPKIQNSNSIPIPIPIPSDSINEESLFTLCGISLSSFSSLGEEIRACELDCERGEIMLNAYGIPMSKIKEIIQREFSEHSQWERERSSTNINMSVSTNNSNSTSSGKISIDMSMAEDVSDVYNENYESSDFSYDPHNDPTEVFSPSVLSLFSRHLSLISHLRWLSLPPALRHSTLSLLRSSLLRDCQLVFCTLSGSAMDILNSNNLSFPFDLVIVDEATQATEINTLIPLRHNVKQGILMGDPLQLPPTVFSSLPHHRIVLERSLFDRLSSCGLPVHQLTIQYRMHPDISQIPNEIFYFGKLVDGNNVQKDRNAWWHTVEKEKDNGKEKEKMFPPWKFIDMGEWSQESSSPIHHHHHHNHPQQHEKSHPHPPRSMEISSIDNACVHESCSVRLAQLSPLWNPHSHHNVSEGMAVGEMIQSLISHCKTHFTQQKSPNISPHISPPVISVGIITFYANQKILIEEILKEKIHFVTNGKNEQNEWGKYISIECQTVDSFQGREKDIILISCVRDGKGKGKGKGNGIGFVDDFRRINVALTRAKFSLWIFGHLEFITKNAEKSKRVWERIKMQRNQNQNKEETENTKQRNAQETQTLPIIRISLPPSRSSATASSFPSPSPSHPH